MEQHTQFNQTVTTEQVVHVPVDEHREALRQAIFRDPAFEAWRKYLAEKRLELSQKVAANEAEAKMADYVEFIQAEYQASRPVAIASAEYREEGRS